MITFSKWFTRFRDGIFWAYSHPILFEGRKFQKCLSATRVLIKSDAIFPFLISSPVSFETFELKNIWKRFSFWNQSSQSKSDIMIKVFPFLLVLFLCGQPIKSSKCPPDSAKGKVGNKTHSFVCPFNWKTMSRIQCALWRRKQTERRRQN